MSAIDYDFGSGRADPDSFPTTALQAAAARAIEQNAHALTEYPGRSATRACAGPWLAARQSAKAWPWTRTIWC